MPDARQSTKTTVFVSYARESEMHSRRVLQLADRLIRDGLDVRLDQHDPNPTVAWSAWMEDNLDTSDCILMVCSPGYHRRVEEREAAGKDLGDQWDGSLIYHRLYETVEHASKFIPILLPDCTLDDIPLPLRNSPRYVIAAFNLSDPGYERLYRYLMMHYGAMKPVLAIPKTPPDDNGIVRPSPQLRYSRRLGSQAPEPEHPILQPLPQPSPSLLPPSPRPAAAPPQGPITEAARLVATLTDETASSLDRTADGRRLAAIGDPRPGVGLRPDGLPDIAWCRVPQEIIYVRGERRELPAFRIGKYPVTVLQFQSFIDADDGYKNGSWWDTLHPDARKQQQKGAGEQHFKFSNHPRDTVSWYEAMAFCRWLSLRLHVTVTLPTEQQWERAAQGPDSRVYPYGDNFDLANGNTAEAGIRQSSAVGAFPAGASPFGVLDMSGNVREWTLAEFEGAPDAVDNTSARRIVRGGSWRLHEFHARTSYRQYLNSNERVIDVGFRLASPADTP